jgi:hypothetical protein
MGRPRTGKRTLGKSLFMRVPFPAAITIAVAPVFQEAFAEFVDPEVFISEKSLVWRLDRNTPLKTDFPQEHAEIGFRRRISCHKPSWSNRSKIDEKSSLDYRFRLEFHFHLLPNTRIHHAD